MEQRRIKAELDFGRPFGLQATVAKRRRIDSRNVGRSRAAERRGGLGGVEQQRVDTAWLLTRGPIGEP